MQSARLKPLTPSLAFFFFFYFFGTLADMQDWGFVIGKHSAEAREGARRGLGFQGLF